MPSFIDRTGYKSGRLTVLSLDLEKSTKKRKFWICICDCGKTKSIIGDALVSKKTKSCGCLQVENQLVQAKKRRQWGPEILPTRHIWKSMWRRCENPKDTVYQYYGARGIRVCDEWKDFNVFLSDMGIRPEGLSLERKDVNGNYCPENCCWVTAKEQARNKRNSKWITLFNQTKCSAEWCEIYNCSQRLFSDRLGRGWDPLKALTTPPRKIDQCWRKNNF
jgi:hypothetical protein